MQEILFKAFQLLLSLSVLIILHELGHFIPAKLFKTRVEKFYLFFDPYFSLFKFKKGETEYGLGWLPLGGYVKISGMVDESMDKDQLSKPPQPWEFRSKPAWQRLIIMIGGVTVNFVLGVLIYAAILFFYGDKYVANSDLKSGVWVVDSLATKIGFENGDKFVSVRGQTYSDFSDYSREMLLGGPIVVDRNGENITINPPEDFLGKLVDKKKVGLMLYPRIPFMISEIPDSSINKKSGFLPKDQVIAMNGEPIRYFDQGVKFLGENKGKDITVKVKRGEGTATVTAKVSAEGKVEIINHILPMQDLERLGYCKLSSTDYTLLQSIPGGFNKAIDKLGFYIKQFKLILNPNTGAYKGMGGFASMGSIFPPTWDTEVFLELTALLSLILAFMNILPIPALDGGHVLFTLYEIITRRKPSDKFLEYAQLTGMALLFSMLIFANGNDIYRFFIR